MTELTKNELADFARLKRIALKHGPLAIDNAEIAGMALKEIRDRRLYRADFKTFEDFCEQVIGRSKPHVHRLIAFEKAKIANPENPPATENEARVNRQTDTHAPTKIGLNGPRNGANGTKKQSQPKAPNTTCEEEPPIHEDCTGFIIPEQWVPLFDRAQEVKDMRRKISEIRVTLEKAQENKDLLFSSVSVSMVVSELDAAYGGLEDGIPFAVCPYCQGQTADHCKCCKGRGLVSKRFYKDVCDPELIRIREMVITQRKGQTA